MNIRQALSQEVEAFLALHRPAETSFGKAACGDWRFVRRLRGADDFRISTVERVRAYIASETARIEAAGGKTNGSARAGAGE